MVPSKDCGRLRRMRWGFAILVGISLVGCAPWQVVGVDAGPEPLEIFVDGQRIAELPGDGLRLRSDRSHVLHFEKPGYRSEQVILESLVGEEGPLLRPASVSVQLRPVEIRSPQIDVELQPISGGVTP